MHSDNSILLEMDVTTVRRLLQARIVSLEDMHSVDNHGKQCLHRLLLEVLKRELVHFPS
ncbi:hypothetical protein [Pseudohongiella acticola]|uniref:hypothetical protein n=1 Tax=Pseudohongiella acticola TaxID=1524254 RepID=UPI0014721019|nr:hypothetical protein [Pseudohongiella acticola]